MKSLLSRLAVATALAAAVSTPALAAVVTFGTANVDHLASSGPRAEAGFTYTASGIGWELQTTRANPGAALATAFNIETSAVGDRVDIVRTGGGDFSFTSIDWSTFSQSPADDVEVQGYLGSTLVGSLSLTGESTTWTTAPGFAGAIDLLRIEITAGGTFDAMALDNVVLQPLATSAVPEPSGLALAGVALAALALSRRRPR